MNGLQFLKEAKFISPRSKRILMTNDSDMDGMTSAINDGEIHHYLTKPWDEDVLISLVRSSYHQYIDETAKMSEIEKIRQQNRDLFWFGKNLKQQLELKCKELADKNQQLQQLNAELNAYTKQLESECLQTPDLTDVLQSVRLDSKTGLLTAASSIARHLNSVFLALMQPYEPDAPPPFSITALWESDPSQDIPHDIIHLLFRTIGAVQPAMLPDRPPQAENAGLMTDALLAFTSQTDAQSPHSFAPTSRISPDTPNPMNLQLTISDDAMAAFIRLTPETSPRITSDDILDYLAAQGVVFGIVGRSLIDTFLNSETHRTKRFRIAMGKPSQDGRDATLTYHFDTAYLKAGKILEDGTIDFKDRGDIPHISRGALLAEKTPGVPGKNGCTVFGEEICVQMPKDLYLGSGKGTEFSEDGLKVYAATDGQPGLTPCGDIWVSDDFVINGDVGYETGHIHYEGNIIVKGSVKTGFQVKGGSLTAYEIEGAEIDLTGDLNISSGIIDSTVSVGGSIQAKFITNSVILAYNDVHVVKGIRDSELLISGRCINTQGKIISSTISALNGFDAGQIGTDLASPCILKAGITEHRERIFKAMDREIHDLRIQLQSLETALETAAQEETGLHMTITEHATRQDRLERELNAGRNAKQALSALEQSNMEKAVAKLSKALDALFLQQDQLETTLSKHKSDKAKLTARVQHLETEKELLATRFDEMPQSAELKAKRSIHAGTILMTPHVTRTLNQNEARCVIREIRQTDEAMHTHWYQDIQPLK